MPTELGALISAEVSRAEVDFQAFRARALSLVGLAGGLVTLIAGFLAIAAGSSKDILPESAHVAVGAAIAFYVLATVLALIINLPVDVEAASADDLQRFAEQNWDDEGWEQQVAIVQATYLKSLRAANQRAAWLLTGGIAAEVLGIASTGLMAWQVIRHL